MQSVLHNRLLDWAATCSICQSWCCLYYGNLLFRGSN